MALEIRPGWDPGGKVLLTVCRQRRELTVSAAGELRQYLLRDREPARLGWVERRISDGRLTRRPVVVGEVVCACLREWEAEQAVIELSLACAGRAQERAGGWPAAGRRLARQVESARRRSKVSALPFRVLLGHHSDPARPRRLSASLAAELCGFYTAGGKPDTQRLRRRAGLAEQHDGTAGITRRQESVSYSTALTLCRALDLDPVELGL